MKTFKTLTNNLTKDLQESHVKLDEMSDTMLLREGMKEELNAIVLYERMAQQANDSRVKQLFLDVAHEEKVHAEEFEELLERLDPDYEDAEDQAEEEIEDMFGKEED